MKSTRPIHLFVLALLAVVAVWSLTACGTASGGAPDAHAEAETHEGHGEGCAHDEPAGGCAHEKPGEGCAHDEPAGGCAHEKPGGHDEGHRGDGQLSLHQIAAARCEHDSLTYECANCRYEIGVVKVPESFLGDDPDGDGGVVRLEVVGDRAVSAGLNVTGEVRLNENAAVHVSPRIPGIIESVAVDIGARVEKGDLLFQIHSVQLGTALSDYMRNRTLVRLAEKNLEREQGLFERKIASEQELIAAQMAYEQHRADLRATEQALRVMGLTRADLDELTRDIRDGEPGTLPVRAPISGRIVEKHAVTGELVEPGRDVMLLADLSSVWVWADVYEQDLSRLLEAEKLGEIPVEVILSAFPGRAFQGSIDYVGATMTEASRTVKVRATVENGEGLLRPGSFCDVRVGIGGGTEALGIPRGAVLSDEGRDFVFLHWKDDFFVRRFVERGREFVDAVEIVRGLEPGDAVVSEGAFLLKSDVLREKMGAGCAD
jgi:cobalt-zinc-cadmium efflux system membrane fusion protein